MWSNSPDEEAFHVNIASWEAPKVAHNNCLLASEVGKVRAVVNTKGHVEDLRYRVILVPPQYHMRNISAFSRLGSKSPFEEPPNGG